VGEQVATNLDATSFFPCIISSWKLGLLKWGMWSGVQAGDVYRTKIFILDGSATPTAPFAAPTVTLYDADRNVVAEWRGYNAGQYWCL
jgi:hypothetical protein